MNTNFCTLCPRHCLQPRPQGFCKAGDEIEVSAICLHQGEEPPISGAGGIVNIFFAHCNLQCVFCQNYQISRGVVGDELVHFRGIDAVVDEVVRLLPESNGLVGFVSPSHYSSAIPTLVEALHQRGLFPTTVYNTNGYDDVAMLQQLEPYIDIYLPDFKYMDSELAQRYSHAADYPRQAQKALREMYRQKGSGLPTDDRGIAYRGIVVRHLVLPSQIANSIAALDWLADEISPNLHLSLMAQYNPLPGTTLPDDLNRTLLPEEYQQVLDHAETIGLVRGWQQELATAPRHYMPDFKKSNPFESK